MKNEHEEHKEMQDILRSELDREAREILAEIEANKFLKKYKMPEGSEEDMMQRIQKLEAKKAAYELMPEEDKEALRLGRELQLQKENKVDSEDRPTVEEEEKVVAFKKKKTRTCLLVAVVAVLVMMMGMTSIGEVPLVTEIREQLFGEKELTKVNSERENADKVEATVDEDIKVYQTIRDTFDVDIIRLDYMPSGTEILDYEIDEALNRATIIYQCEDTIFDYRMIFNYRSQSYGYLTTDELVDEQNFTMDDMSVQLREYKIKNSSEKEYVIEFICEDVRYILNATTCLPEAEIEKIIKNLKIF